MTKPASGRWPTEREAELAAARAGHHVPATHLQDRRCWACIHCGGAIPKKRCAPSPEAPGGYVPYWDKKCPHCGYNAKKWAGAKAK